MNKRPKVLVVGSLVMDLTVSTGRLPAQGETILGLDFQTAPGGKGANQAVQLARLGADVTFVGKVGSDHFGQQLIASLDKAGVNTDHISVSERSASAIGNVLLEFQNQEIVSNRIIVVPGANMKITPNEIAFLKETISDYDMVLLQLEIPMEINELVAGYAHDKGVPVMLNPAPFAPLNKEFLRNITYISPNEPETAQLSGVNLRDSADEVDLTLVERAAQKIAAMGAENVLITLGDVGAAMYRNGELQFSPSIHAITAQDPTAAGDSFIGSFCMGLCSGLDFSQTLCFANMAAAVTVSRKGAQPSLPVLSEVQNLDDLMMSHQFDWHTFAFEK